MPYITVFDISKQPFEWWWPAIGLVIATVGIIFIKFVSRWPRQKNAKIIGWVMVTFGLIFTIVVYNSVSSMWADWRAAYERGAYSTAEGVVQDFKPMPYEGHQDECFRVQNERFCYSDYIVQPGFHQSASHGGPIREGLPVRIAYYEDENFQARILRLEIRSDSLPSVAERSTYPRNQEQKWQRTLTEDHSRNDAMLIGFLMAGFAWTLWWNIDWQRFIKFYGVNGPPYRRWIEVAVRGFFALCSLGAAEQLWRRVLERTRPAQFYRNAFLIAVAWFVVIVLMVKAVEWLAKRRRNVTVSQ